MEENIFNEIIERETKLNKLFGFEHTIEVYALFNYLLYNGFLSTDKSFNFKKKRYVNLNNGNLFNVFNGYATNVEIYELLNYVFKSMGIKSRPILAYKTEYRGSLKDFDSFFEETYTNSSQDFKECIKKLTYTGEINKIQELDISERKKERLLDEIKKNNGNIIIKETPKNFQLLKRIFGNTIVVLTNQNERLHFLDINPYNDGICSKKAHPYNGQEVLYSLSDAFLAHRYICAINFFIESKLCSLSIDDLENAFSYFVNRPVWEDSKKIYDSATKICEENVDILNEFYKENRKLYQEVSTTLSRRKN